MNRKKHTFKVAIVSNKLFAAKVMYAIDIRFQRWLGECKRARDRCEVDNRIIDLREILNDISNSRFFVELPPPLSQNQLTLRMRAALEEEHTKGEVVEMTKTAARSNMSRTLIK